MSAAAFENNKAQSGKGKASGFPNGNNQVKRHSNCATFSGRPCRPIGPRRRTTISRPVGYGDEMSRAQRVILELQDQVTNLRAGISTGTSTMEVALRAQEVAQQPTDGAMSQ
jgi:hypothetical protein